MRGEFKGTSGHWQLIESPMDGLIVIQEGSLDEGAGFISYTPIASEFQCEEDAKLIAAAPDLLMALKELLFERQSLSTDYSSVTEVINAQKAIKKALGE